MTTQILLTFQGGITAEALASELERRYPISVIKAEMVEPEKKDEVVK